MFITGQDQYLPKEPWEGKKELRNEKQKEKKKQRRVKFLRWLILRAYFD